MTATPVTANRALAAAALLLGLLALFVETDAAPGGASAEIDALAVARAIRADPESMLIVDIRDREAFDALHLPRAVHLPIDPTHTGALARAEWRRNLEALGAARDRSIVVAGEPDLPTRLLWIELRRAGYEAFYMPDMLADWLETIVSPVRGPIEDPADRAAWDEQAELARYFGGFPRVGSTPGRTGSVSERLRHARRRGCAI